MTHLRISDEISWASDDDSDSNDDIVFIGANRSQNHHTPFVLKQEFDADSLIEDSEDQDSDGNQEEDEEDEEDSSMLDDDSDLDEGMDVLDLWQDGDRTAACEGGDDGEVLKMLLARADSRRNAELRIEGQGVERSHASNGSASPGTQEKMKPTMEGGSIRR